MKPTELAIEQAVHHLRHRNSKVRARAEQTLIEFGPHAIPRLLECYEYMSAGGYWESIDESTLGAVAILVLYPVIDQYSGNGIVLTGLLLMLWLCVAVIQVGSYRKSAMESLMRVLDFSDDPRTCGYQIERTLYQRSGNTIDRREKLLRMLPGLESLADSGVQPKHLTTLARSISMADPHWSSRILEFLHWHGTHNELIYLEPLSRAISWNPDNKDLVRRAKEALDAIRNRIRLSNTNAALLRPADAPTDSTLLRPAGPGEAEEQNLLRPMVGDELQE